MARLSAAIGRADREPRSEGTTDEASGLQCDLFGVAEAPQRHPVRSS